MAQCRVREKSAFYYSRSGKPLAFEHGLRIGHLQFEALFPKIWALKVRIAKRLSHIAILEFGNRPTPTEDRPKAVDGK
jgi:hypothetical protein